MGAFFISPPNPTDWHITSEELEARARERWSDVQVTHSDEPERPYPTHMMIDGRGPMIIAGLDREGSTLFVEGTIDQAIEVAQWFRQQVPPSEALVFFDEEYTNQIDLTADTTQDELQTPFT